MKALLLTYEGMEDALSAVLGDWSMQLKIGLFTNTEEPQPWWTISQITPAAFEGYPGLLTVNYWRQGVRVNDVFVSNSGRITWTKEGSGTGEYIYGVYLTDYLGTRLRLVQRFDKPVTVVYDQDTVTYQPTIACGSLAIAKGEPV